MKKFGVVGFCFCVSWVCLIGLSFDCVCVCVFGFVFFFVFVCVLGFGVVGLFYVLNFSCWLVWDVLCVFCVLLVF